MQEAAVIGGAGTDASRSSHGFAVRSVADRPGARPGHYTGGSPCPRLHLSPAPTSRSDFASTPERLASQLIAFANDLPSNDAAREWRERCRARFARPRSREGQMVIFTEPLRFLDGAEHRVLRFEGGSRFRSREGALYRVPSWSTLDYRLRS